MAGYIYRGGRPHIELTARTFRPGADPERAARMAELRGSHAAGPHTLKFRRGTRAVHRRRAIDDQQDR